MNHAIFMCNCGKIRCKLSSKNNNSMFVTDLMVNMSINNGLFYLKMENINFVSIFHLTLIDRYACIVRLINFKWRRPAHLVLAMKWHAMLFHSFFRFLFNFVNKIKKFNFYFRNLIDGNSSSSVIKTDPDFHCHFAFI